MSSAVRTERRKSNESSREDGMLSIHCSTPETGKWWNWRLIGNLIIVGFALGVFGYDNAFVSPLVSLPLFVEKYQGPGFNGAMQFSARNLNLIITIPLVGAAIGSFAAVPLQKQLGRKGTYVFACGLLCIPGSILQLLAPNLGALVFGRFWNYVGVSLLTNVAPVYLSELIPAHARARAVGLTVACNSAISVVAAVVVWATEKRTDRWQYMIPLLVQVLFPATLLVFSLLLTESPIWLLSRGKEQLARQNLLALRAGNLALVEKELAIAAQALPMLAEVQDSPNVWDIFRLKHIERTMMAAALLSLSQVGGQILVQTYSTVLLVQSGVADPFKITILIFLLQFAGTVVGPFMLDKVGRRPIALYGFTVLAIIDFVGGGIACTGLVTDATRKGLAALCIIFAFFNAVSFGSISYVLPTEIPTAQLRELSMTWAVFWTYTTAIITTYAVPQIMSPDAGNLGARTFLIFGSFMIVTVVLSYFFLPETMNRTLPEIDALYLAKVPKRHWRGWSIPDPALS